MKHLFCITLFIALFSFAAPSISTSLTVDDFMADPDIFDMDISPNGKYLAEVLQAGKLRIVVIRDLTTPNFAVTGRIGDDILRPYRVRWANDERLIVDLLVPYDTKRVRRESEREDDFDIDEHYMFSRSITVDNTGKKSHFSHAQSAFTEVADQPFPCAPPATQRSQTYINEQFQWRSAFTLQS